MIDSILLLNSTGEVIIEKHYRGTTERPTVTTSPITATSNGANITLKRNGLTLLANVKNDTPVILVTEFLTTLTEILSEYFGELNEHAIKDNFITVYELLDEMLDNGVVATLEPNALKELINPPSMLNKVFETLGAEGSRVVNAPMSIPWRRGNVRHAQNEIFVDITETLDVMIKGRSRECRVLGSVAVTSHLSGLPEIVMRLNGNSPLDDVCLHHCVRPRTFDGCVRFVPPDGRFEVMRYIIRDTRAVGLPIEIGHKIDVDEASNSGNLSITLTPRFSPPREYVSKLVKVVGSMNIGKKDDCVMSDVSVKIVFGENVVGCSLSGNYGSVSFSNGCCDWVIGNVQRGKIPCLVGNITTSGSVPSPTLLVSFTIPGVAASGIGVDSLEIVGESYKYYKGLKCVTKAGLYQLCL